MNVNFVTRESSLSMAQGGGPHADQAGTLRPGDKVESRAQQGDQAHRTKLQRTELHIEHERSEEGPLEDLSKY